MGRWCCNYKNFFDGLEDLGQVAGYGAELFVVWLLRRLPIHLLSSYRGAFLYGTSISSQGQEIRRVSSAMRLWLFFFSFDQLDRVVHVVVSFLGMLFCQYMCSVTRKSPLLLPLLPKFRTG